MKQIAKYTLTFLLCITVLLMLPFLVNATEMHEKSEEENVSCRYDGEGTLIISGTGMIEDPLKDDQVVSKEEITSVVIQDGISGIGDYAFSQYTNLTNILIPNSVTYVGNHAFEQCSNLTSISIPDSVSYVGSYAFYRCGQLREVKLGNGISVIKEGTFEFCNKLTDVVIGEGVTSIAPWAFHACRSLATIKLPDGLEEIREAAFSVCDGLTQLELPDSVLYLGTDAFSACTSLNSVILSANMITIGDSAFESCKGLTDIIIPDCVTSIDSYAFASCTGLKSVLFMGNAPKMGYGIFLNVEATAYYLFDKENWTVDVKQNYEGSINWKAVNLQLDIPVVTASSRSSNGKPVIKWTPIDGAVKYYVYSSTNKNTWKRLSTTASTSITNISALTGKYYYYYVVAIDAEGNSSLPSNIVGRTCDLPRPEVSVSNVASTGKIKLTWDKIEGAKSYKVYRSTDNKTWNLLKEVTGSLTNTSATVGKKYYYKVMAIHSKSAANSAYSTVVSRTCDLPSPTVKTGNVASSGKIKLAWEKVEGAKSYEVYRSTDNKTWTLMKTVTGTIYTNTTAKAGTKYYYKVRALHSKSAANSAYSEVVSRTCDLARPTVTVKLNNAGKPLIGWEKVEGAVKYEVFIYASNGVRLKTSTVSGLKLTHTSAKKGTTYGYRVVAVYSNTAANSAKSVKVTINSK